MHSPLTALAWEIWQRGRRAAQLALGCAGLCALINLAVPEPVRAADTAQAVFGPLFGLLMVLSLFLSMGIFNYTEYSASREWNGFPYRLFALPIRTWKLVLLPMLLGVAAVELLYLAWIKLVWTHHEIPKPEWFAVVLGAYLVSYLAVLWSLAGFRILRLLVLGLGGVSSILVALLPFFSGIFPSPWCSERRDIPLVLGMAVLAYGVAWGAVARQRCGGGRRHSRIKALAERLSDRLPRRTGAFASPAGAQFWFEWRRTGLLLPLYAALALAAIFGPCSWIFRHDPQYTLLMLVRLLVTPLILAFAIGKAFIKPELWSGDAALTAFQATRPLPDGEFVISKMKSAALSTALAWLFVLGFMALWLPLWADTTDLNRLLGGFRLSYPQSWLAILVLSFAGLAVLTWRCLVSGLWVGLSGKRSLMIATSCLQVGLPASLMLAAGLCSQGIDAAVREHPNEVRAAMVSAAGWLLALAVAAKLGWAVWAWSKITPRRTRQYLLLWSGATLGFVALGMLASPREDLWRVEHLYVLAALLMFPLARIGMAPRALAGNRHR
jgi:hypothetical protein